MEKVNNHQDSKAAFGLIAELSSWVSEGQKENAEEMLPKLEALHMYLSDQDRKMARIREENTNLKHHAVKSPTGNVVKSTVLHAVDVGMDIYVLVQSFGGDFDFFFVNLCLQIISSFVAAFAMNWLTPLGKPKVKWNDENTGHRCSLFPIIGGFLGLFHLHIFVDAYYSIVQGEKTPGFAFGRLYEVVYEAMPHLLYQIFFIVKDRTLDHDTLTQYQAILVCSNAVSLLSTVRGVINFEHYEDERDSREDRKDRYRVRKWSAFSLCLSLYRLGEVLARVSLLACAAVAVSGWFIVVVLVIDYLLFLFIFFRTNNIKTCADTKALVGIVFGLGMVGMMWAPIIDMFPIVQEYCKYHWSIKFVESVIMIFIIAVQLGTTGYSFTYALFSTLGVVAFFVQYFALFFVLEWANNITMKNKELCHPPSPFELVIYRLPFFKAIHKRLRKDHVSTGIIFRARSGIRLSNHSSFRVPKNGQLNDSPKNKGAFEAFFPSRPGTRVHKGQPRMKIAPFGN